MIDLVEMYVHWDAGRSQVQISESLGVDRKTVRKYLAPVTEAGMTPGGPPVMIQGSSDLSVMVWSDMARRAVRT